ncbi:MAG: ABC transporter ATP-binding protein [Alphaproteobacteria bacterium]|nr:MAG: ABC transporter ATP-binding protein [Alphaproteobacteria bacterium]
MGTARSKRGLRLAADQGQATAAPGAAPLIGLDLQGLSLGGRAILGPIALELRPAETLAVTGPSGIGKTTLLRVLAGLETGFAGTLTAPQRIAMVFQEPRLLPWRTARANLCLTTGIDAARANAALAEVGLASLGDHFPGQLSLGQQRRLALARAFAAEPDALLMDEPFVSLDPENAEEMMRLFARLRAARQLATVLVTHVEAEAQKLASRIIRLGGAPATIVEERPNRGAWFDLPASGVTAPRS